MRFKSYRNKSTTGLTRPLMPSTSTSTTTGTATATTVVSTQRLKNILLCLSLLFIVYLLFNQPTPHPPILPRTPLPTTRRHILFSIASSSASWSRRKPFVRLWYSPDTTRAFVFLDKPVVTDSKTSVDDDRSVPPVIISADTSRFPYKFRGGLRSAIRVARVVKEIVDRGESDVRWFVFGDDDTVFFVDNLVKTLSKYDHEQWYYVGSNSEGYDQNVKNSFDMAFGGGGFAISSSLAKPLAGVFDSCLMRYAHLYGSDARVFSCLAELGVGLTHEPGFHQV